MEAGAALEPPRWGLVAPEAMGRRERTVPRAGDGSVGGDALGGAIYNEGVVRLCSVKFVDNSVQAGGGGSGGTAVPAAEGVMAASVGPGSRV